MVVEGATVIAGIKLGLDSVRWFVKRAWGRRNRAKGEEHIGAALAAMVHRDVDISEVRAHLVAARRAGVRSADLLRAEALLKALQAPPVGRKARAKKKGPYRKGKSRRTTGRRRVSGGRRKSKPGPES